MPSLTRQDDLLSKLKAWKILHRLRQTNLEQTSAAYSFLSFALFRLRIFHQNDQKRFFQNSTKQFFSKFFVIFIT